MLEQWFSALIKRRKRPEYEAPISDTRSETEVVVETENAIVEIPVEEVKEERAAPASKQEWQQIQDPYGRPCWRHIETGQVTYGNSYAMPQQGYNPALAQQGFSDVPLPVQAPGPGVVMPPGVNYGVSPAPYMSPAPYGASPVAMYPAAPWNNNMMAPVSPVPHQVPEYVKRQRADELAKAQAEEAARVKATAELEAEKKRLAMGGVWERYYGDNGGRYWQNTATGETRATDPYR